MDYTPLSKGGAKMHGCTPQCVGAKMFVLGLVLILARLYTSWDMWVVVGSILIIKAVLLFIMPTCKCQTKSKKK